VAKDYDKALLDPGAVFSGPEEVLEDTVLSKAQKIEVLRRWEYDASELAVAEEEGMQDGEPSLLRRILLALDALTGGVDVSHTPPTKQGGV
jgi:hypothetical protein